MHNIFKYLIESDLTTKLFILSSILALAVIQYFLFKVRFKWVVILFINVLFGLFLSQISTYSPIVHVVLYVLPSALIAGLLYVVFPAKKNYVPTKYDISLKTNKGTISFNPFAGVVVLGVPKAGKTASVVKPTIQQMAEKDFCGMIYDFKRDDLTKCAYYHYMNHSSVDFKMINFFDLNRSHRVNPIHPDIIQHPSYATEAAYVFLANMMGGSTNQASLESKYWIDSAAGVLAAIIWNLKTFTPEWCDLPHAITILITQDAKALQKYFEQNDQSVFMAASFFKSLASEKQLAGILGTLASAVSKIALPEIFYAMSGNEVNLILNDPAHPTLLTLSTTNDLRKTYSPALAMIISTSLKLMNKPDRHHSNVMIEEASTLIIPEFDNTPATARSNKIGTFIIAQDIIQLEDGYSRIGRDKMLANLSTHIYGKVTDPDTAERYSKMFGTIDKYYTSKNRKPGALTNSGYTDSLREIRKYKPEIFHNLDTGQFLGIIGDGNIKELNARFSCYHDIDIQLPMVRNISKFEVQAVFERIIEESKNIF